MKNILQYLEHTVRRVPYQVFLADSRRTMTYREVYDQARAIGSFLIQQGITEKPVLVPQSQGARAVTIFLGAVYSGNVYVPLVEKGENTREKLLLKQLGPDPVIFEGDFAEAAPESRCFGYDQAAFGVIREDLLAQVRQSQVDLDPVSVHIQTGEGIVSSHQTMIHRTEQLCSVLGFSADTVFASLGPGVGLEEWIPAMKYGGCVCFLSREQRKSPQALLEGLKKHRVNTLCWEEAALRPLTGALGRLPGNLLKTLGIWGDNLSADLVKGLQAAAPEAACFRLYYPSRITGVCCYHRIREGEPIPLGSPLPNTQILLLNDRGQPVGAEEPGQIYIRGSRLALGCFREVLGEGLVQNPTHTRYPDPVYPTGDVGMYRHTGELILLGRKGDPPQQAWDSQSYEKAGKYR